MKKISLCIALCMICIASAWGQAPDCLRDHSGKFNNVQDGQILGTITRKGDRQIEQYGKEKIFLDVKWVNDCTYELRLIKVNGVFKKAHPNANLSRVVTAEIVRTDDKGYYLVAHDNSRKNDEGEEMHFVRVK